MSQGLRVLVLGAEIRALAVILKVEVNDSELGKFAAAHGVGEFLASSIRDEVRREPQTNRPSHGGISRWLTRYSKAISASMRFPAWLRWPEQT
jgi:hypothetical protein